MSDVQLSSRESVVDPLPDNLQSVQPGGGFCYRVELAWGGLRRWYLKRFRPGYVRRMAALRRGDLSGCRQEVLDPRDLKYVSNQCTCHWDPADDPFAWREMLPFARWGLAELQLMGYPLLVATVALACSWWYLAPLPAIVLGLIVYFFRDPPRRVPQDPGLLVAPADGTVAEITPLEHDPFIGGPAVRIGIFLSIFNVHINRMPQRARVLKLHYSPGEFLNAMNPASALRNENLWIGLQQTDGSQRRIVVRQIAGLIARRIVCVLRPGQQLDRGEKFGMIKLGSRTEMIVPAESDLEVLVAVGDRVRAGSSVMVSYKRC